MTLSILFMTYFLTKISVIYFKNYILREDQIVRVNHVMVHFPLFSIVDCSYFLNIRSECSYVKDCNYISQANCYRGSIVTFLEIYEWQFVLSIPTLKRKCALQTCKNFFTYYVKEYHFYTIVNDNVLASFRFV